MGLSVDYESETTMEYCQSFFAKHINTKNVFFARDLAIHYNLKKRYDSCMDFLEKNNPLFEAKGFSDCRLQF